MGLWGYIEGGESIGNGFSQVWDMYEGVLAFRPGFLWGFEMSIDAP